MLGTGTVALNVTCVPGQDGHIGSGDACLDSTNAGAHIISCKDAPKLP